MHSGRTAAVIGVAMGAMGALLGAQAVAAASPLDMFGLGGESPALAGTGVATSTNYDSVYLNPAGLAHLKRKRITFGGQSGNFSLSLDGEDTGTERPDGVVFGGAIPIPLGGALRDRVGFAIAVHFPPVVINRARSPLPGNPWFALLENRAQVVAMQTAVGVRINDRWSAGAGVLTLAALAGRIHISADPSGRFRTQSEQELVANFTPIIGVRHQAKSDLRVGLTFRGVARTDFDLIVTNSLADSLPLTIPTLNLAGASQYDPLTVAAEAAWQATPSLMLTGQLAYQRWGAFPLPTVNPVEAAPPQEPPDFHDTVVPRVAAEWRTNMSRTELAVRAGYFFAMSPARPQEGLQALLDNHRHVLTAGLGLAFPHWSSPIHIDVWAQAHLLQPRRHTKDLEAIGPGHTLPYYSIESRGRILVGGLTLGVDL